jgi:predicted transcriptional regulator of viral defense system
MVDEKSTLKRLRLLSRLFRKQDVEKLTPHSAVFLSRAVQKGLIHRLNRGNYVNSFLHGFPRVEEVACFLRPPAYITCEWALNFHGISPQSPVVCTAATLSSAVGKDRRIEYQEVSIEFSRISPSLFFGFTLMERFYMATPEKALLDTLHLRKRLPTPDELELEEINVDSLRAMAGKFSSTVYKKIAALIPSLDAGKEFYDVRKREGFRLP